VPLFDIVLMVVVCGTMVLSLATLAFDAQPSQALPSGHFWEGLPLCTSQ
jgi:hypothetical protein